MEKVKLKCTDNGTIVEANLVYKNDNSMKVHIVQGDIVLVLMKKGTIYVGSKVGLEFTSDRSEEHTSELQSQR